MVTHSSQTTSLLETNVPRREPRGGLALSLHTRIDSRVLTFARWPGRRQIQRPSCRTARGGYAPRNSW